MPLAGIVVTGVTTSTSFSGALTGNVSATFKMVYRIPNITVGSVVLPLVHLVVMCLFAGTLTKED